MRLPHFHPYWCLSSFVKTLANFSNYCLFYSYWFTKVFLVRYVYGKDLLLWLTYTLLVKSSELQSITVVKSIDLLYSVLEIFCYHISYGYTKNILILFSRGFTVYISIYKLFSIDFCACCKLGDKFYYVLHVYPSWPSSTFWKDLPFSIYCLASWA